MHAERRDNGEVRLSLTHAEAITIREAIAFADFNDDLPARDPAEVEAISSLLVSLDGLIPELGSEKYGAVVSGAWAEINSSR